MNKGALAAAALLADPAALKMRLVAERARRSGERSFSAFVRQAWQYIPGAGALEWNDYLDGLCAALEAVARRRIKRLVANGPPRTGKSNCFAIMWPAWIWTWKPREEFVFLSYSQDLVREHSVKCRALVESQWYRETFRPPWKLEADRNTQTDFANTAGGRRIAASMAGAGITGRGGNVIGIDDPLSAEESGSQAVQQEAVRVLEQVLLSRFNNPATGVAAMTMQRVDAHDPTAWAVRRGWKHMCVPLEAYETPPLLDDAGEEVWRDKRAPGDVLAPERFTPERVAEIRSNLVLHAAQFQQQPIAHVSAGMYFPRGKFAMLDVAPLDVDVRVRSWDLAATQGGGDWTVGVKLARLKSGRFVIEDVVRAQLDGAAVRELVLNTARMDGWDCRVTIPQDPGQAGKDQAQDYVTRLGGYSVELRRPDAKKELRAGPASAQVLAGNVSLVRAPWNEPLLQTLDAFPDPAVHDDDADALADAVATLAQKQKSGLDLWDDVDI